ncbi:MAG TPA: CBS domain-containing protein, partial [Myxococcaceae bacterium]|nr:CBS domain-containing protein [Myxococcaceae bacterium]
RDERNQSDRAGPSGDTAGSDERLQGGQQGSGQGRFEDAGQGRSTYGQGLQSLGQRGLGRSPGEGAGLRETSDRQIGQDRGDEGGHDDRSTQSGATGMSAAYAGSGASYGSGRDEQRAGDQGQGRRFWQREPLSARDVMTRNPKTVTRQTSIREAAVVMRDENCGAVPVVDGAGRLEGILTDRDIVVRGLVDENTQRRVENVMTDDVSAVTEDEPVTSVMDLMGRKQVRRVPVVDRNDRLLGIISMADIANRADYDEDLQDAFERISSRRSFWSLFS